MMIAFCMKQNDKYVYESFLNEIVFSSLQIF